MPSNEQKRLTAVKVKIRDILNSKFIKNEGIEPSYLDTNGKKISRINSIGIVISKDINNSYESIVLDDGTGRISARFFEKKGLPENISVGDAVLLIGKVREYGELYVAADILRKLEDKRWIDLRNKEFNLIDLQNKHYSSEMIDKKTTNEKKIEEKKNDAVEEELIVERVVSPKQRVFDLIRKLDGGNGAQTEDILNNLNIQNGEKIIDSLLKTGDVFEVGPGRLKVLE